VSSLAPTVSSPTAPRPRRTNRSAVLDLGDLAILELSAAEDIRAGMRQAVKMLRRTGGAARVEWWAPTADGRALALEAADGRGHGRRTTVSAGPAGTLVITGDHWSPRLVAAVNRLAPQLRRRWTEEQLALEAARLARRNEALEDFASLVAHELKAPLHAALLLEDPAAGVELALELVDSLLEAARAESAANPCSAPADALEQALRDLGPINAEVAADLPDRFPLSGGGLRLVLRNLIANALAAGAHHIDVTAGSLGATRTLVVDDDGVGLDAPGEYAGGSGLGLRLIDRLARRYGGAVELSARPLGRGTRATLTVSKGRP